MKCKILHIGLCVQPEPYNGFQQAFIDVVGKENYKEISTGEENLNAKTLLIFDEFKPDIVFMQIQAPDIIIHGLCERFKDAGAFVINWTGDKRHNVPQWMIDMAPYVSLTAFSNMEDVNKMRALGFNSKFLEIGYDPEIYTPIGEVYHVPEIVFMGNNYGSGYFPMSKFRIEMVEFLQREYGERFGVYGNGWPNANGNINHSQLEEAKHYRGAKIAINCSHFDCDTYNSDRILRIFGSGILCVSYDHVNMYNIYQDNLCYFKDFKDLKLIIDEYLINESTRETIAECGRNLAKSNFTFKHQVENIIKLVS